MVSKKFIKPEELRYVSFQLAREILDTDFKPDFMVALWRGGTPVGCYVQEFLKHHGTDTDHIAIRTSAYTGVGQMNREVRVHGLDYFVKHANEENSLLIVDDVYDTGKSIDAVIKHLRKKSRKNTPHDIRIAIPYFKPNNNKTSRVPEFYIHKTDDWLVFPHELDSLTKKDIIKYFGRKYNKLFDWTKFKG
jgi:uncharacterized protein